MFQGKQKRVEGGGGGTGLLKRFMKTKKSQRERGGEGTVRNGKSEYVAEYGKVCHSTLGVQSQVHMVPISPS